MFFIGKCFIFRLHISTYFLELRLYAKVMEIRMHHIRKGQKI